MPGPEEAGAILTPTPPETAAVLKALFSHVPPGVIEVRLLCEDKKAKRPAIRRWYPSAEALIEVLPRMLPIVEKEQRGIFFGVLPRSAARKSKAQDTLPGMALWTDLDFKDYGGGEEEARGRLEAFPLPPSIRVMTGHGLHNYWLMKEPQPVEVLTLLTARLGMFLGGDRVHDAPRLLRLPGTFNRKNSEQPLPVVVEHFDAALRYTPEDLEKALPEIKQMAKRRDAKARSRRKPALVGEALSPRVLEVFEGYPEVKNLFEGRGKPERDAEGHRLDTSSSGYDYSLLCALISHGVTDEAELATVLWLRPDGGARAKGSGYVRRSVSKALKRSRRPAGPASGLPSVFVNGRQLREVVADAWGAVHAANTGPSLFQRSGLLVRLNRVEGMPRIDVMDEPAMFGHLARLADWMRLYEEGPAPVPPCRDTTRDMLAYPDPALPVLEAVLTTPVFDREGRLVSEPGYHPGSRLWLHRPEGFALGEIPERPTREGIRSARDLFLEDLLVDFPFASASDRAHLLAAILLPFVRRMVEGCTPVHLLEAPGPGAGKGLMADLVSIVALGRPCEPTTLAEDEEEARKKITSLLLRGQPVILLDNVNHAIESAQLASALTAETWSDRILGQTKMIDLPNRSTWILAANNPRLSLEIARRCLRVRLDPRTDRPWERTGFKHQPLRAWAMAQRPALVRSALTLGTAWVAAGKPPGARTLGSFEGWAAVLGGILETAGVPGFLEGMERLYQEADQEGQAWREFVAAWWEARQGNWVGAQELLKLVLNLNLLGQVVGDKSERSQMVRLGKALSSVRDRQFGGYRILSGIDEHRKAARYRLVPAEDRSQVLPGTLAPATGREGCAVAGRKDADRPSLPPEPSGQESTSRSQADLRGMFPTPQGIIEADPHAGED